MYEQLNAHLQGRNYNSRKLANHTYMIRCEDGSIAVKLHATNVVTIKPDDTVILNSGGWVTPTTKDRINDTISRLGWFIYQEKRQWFVRNYQTRECVVFKDGMSLKDDVWTGAGSLASIQGKKKLIGKIKVYTERFFQALVKGYVGIPGSGDCWYCSMITAEGKSMGDISHSNHLLPHIESNDFVPSLLWNALQEYGSPYSSMFALEHMRGNHSLYGMDGLAKKQIITSLRKYLYKRLKIGV